MANRVYGVGGVIRSGSMYYRLAEEKSGRFKLNTGQKSLRRARVSTDADGFCLDDDGWYEAEWLNKHSYFAPATVLSSVKYLLGVEGVFEPLASEKALRERITELAAEPDLKRDSLVVYDVKRARKVELGVKITIK